LAGDEVRLLLAMARPVTRVIILMRRDGYTFREIAQGLRVRESTARALFYAAIQRLHEHESHFE
jgi:DNA-directed RNA polymerase specialized sigma24 family protein